MIALFFGFTVFVIAGGLYKFSVGVILGGFTFLFYLLINSDSLKDVLQQANWYTSIWLGFIASELAWILFCAPLITGLGLTLNPPLYIAASLLGSATLSIGLKLTSSRFN